MKLALICVLLGVDYWACAVKTTGPIDQTGVRVVIQFSSSSGSPAQPVTVDAAGINDRSSSVYHDVPCASTVVGFEVNGPDGKAVLLRDPRFIPACPDYCCQELGSHKSVDSELQFDGTLYTASGQRYDAPPGNYTVKATFDVSTKPQGGSALSATNQAVFRWASR